MVVFATPLQSTKELNAGKSSIKVFVRARPLLEKEILDGAHNVLSVLPDEKQVLVEEGVKGIFTYDGVCNENTTQEDIFQLVVSPLLKHMRDGQNVTVIAYGQTSSGKSYTMGTNPVFSQENGGMLQRVMKALLNSEGRQETDKENVNEDNVHNEDEKGCSLKLSFLEVYSESVYDLFSSRAIIGTKPDGFGGVIPVNCKEETVSTVDEGLKLLETGNNLRKVAATVMNSHSSRSHALISLTLHQKQNGVSLPKGCLRMVDLAGAEGVGRNNTGGKGFCEGVFINKGLLAIGKVLTALSSNNSSSHIPYRESMVTRLLRDSLGGNSYTAMVTCVSPASTNLSVTLNTLRYAEQARNIRNKPTGFSAVKRTGIKRGLDDVSATPSAWKKFVSGKKPSHHNSTISTPGHKPPVAGTQPFNNTFVTPLNRTNDLPRNFPRSSSRNDLTSLTNFPLKQPVFEEESSPTQSIIVDPQANNNNNNNTVIQISPLVERVNSRLEQSILQYEQRMQTQMKDMENRLAKKVARMLIGGTQSKRRSKRLQLKSESISTNDSPPAPLNKQSDSLKESSRNSNDSSFGLNDSNDACFSFADSIAKSLVRRNTFQTALKGAIKAENENDKKKCVSKDKKSANEINPLLPVNVRRPFEEISNLDNSSAADETIYFGRDDMNSNHFPVTSTVACSGKVIRKSTRLSSGMTSQTTVERKRSCFISPLHLTMSPALIERHLRTEKTIVYDSDNTSADSEDTVIFRDEQSSSSSPDLRKESVQSQRLTGRNSTTGVLPRQVANRKKTTTLTRGGSNRIGNITVSDSRLGALLPTDSPSSEVFCNTFRRRSTRRSAVIASQRNFDILSAKESPFKISRRRSTKKSVAGGEKWQLVVSPTLQKKHSNAILKILNTANLRGLQKLPTIGPKTAMVIHNFREMYGKLKTAEDIQKIPGLPKSYYARFMKANLMHHINLD